MLLFIKEQSECSTEENANNRIWVFFFSSEDVPAEMANPITTKYSTPIEQIVQKRAYGVEKDKVLWNVDANEIPKSFWD